MSRCVLMIASAAVVVLGLSAVASAGHPAHWYTYYDRGAYWASNNRPWHHVYSHTMYGQPMALIVPPTANMQTNYSWGVGRTRMSPVLHQFARPVPVPGTVGPYNPTPAWPSDTNQFGVYSVRAPW
ncbi:MAG: hypothetical protein U0795_15415 [Pirellulales bacterium]